MEKKDKRTLFGDGKAHVVTDDDFVLALEDIEKGEREREEGKEKRKEARAKAKESKMAEKKAWERALEEWKGEKKVWEEECLQLKEGGCRRKDLLKAPKRPKKADVVLAALDKGSEGDSESSEGSSDEDMRPTGTGPAGGTMGRTMRERTATTTPARESSPLSAIGARMFASVEMKPSPDLVP